MMKCSYKCAQLYSALLEALYLKCLIYKCTLKISVWLGVFMLQNLETALAGGLGQMSLVNDYQTF